MPVKEVDTLVHIFTVPEDRIVGVASKYADENHPGTNQKVSGWKWDERYWPTTKEFNATSFAPSLWDPSTSGLHESIFQSGYGDNKDLLMLGAELTETSGDHSWTPKVNHGYFYNYDKEWYLYSDLFQTQYFAKSISAAGRQYIDLDYNFKPTIPIQVRRYEYDSVLDRQIASLDFRRKVEFVTSGSEPEFMVGTTVSGIPRLWVNGEWGETVGTPIELIGGFALLSEMEALELVGISDGTTDQRFRTVVSPIDLLEEVEVWTYFLPSWPRQWDILSGVEPFTNSGQQVHVDYDRGILSFGDWNAETSGGAGLVPMAGERVKVHYTKGLAALYEPEFSHDYILAKDANVNPVASLTYRGFVQVLTEIPDPVSITLEAELPTASPTYLINMGNNTGRLIATVKDSAGRLLEGEEITFEVMAPAVGSFGAANTMISAITDTSGEARAIYNAPTTIDDVGAATDDISLVGGNTQIDVEGLTDPGTVSGLYLYKIHYWDPPLGIPASGLDDYYDTYLAEEDAVSGLTAIQSWEEDFRTMHELGRPVSYANDNLSIGKKTAILTAGKSNVVDTHAGTFTSSGLSPLYAFEVEEIGTSVAPKLRLTYSGTLPLPGIDDTKAYFVVGNAQTSIRAYVTNRHTGAKLYSNEITMRVTIPSTASGTYFADQLSNVTSGMLTRTKNVNDIDPAIINLTSGEDEYDDKTFHDSWLDERQYTVAGGYESYVDWFRRTRGGDSTGLGLVGLGLDTILINAGIEDQPGEIPLGFRLKSTGITVASILDQVTYLDPNDILPSGYYEV